MYMLVWLSEEALTNTRDRASYSHHLRTASQKAFQSKFDRLLILYDSSSKMVRIHCTEFIQSLYGWRKRMSQSELEPVPVTFNITIADASNLPIHHVNALGLRAGSDEFFFTLGVVMPPD